MKIKTMLCVDKKYENDFIEFVSKHEFTREIHTINDIEFAFNCDFNYILTSHVNNYLEYYSFIKEILEKFKINLKIDFLMDKQIIPENSGLWASATSMMLI